MAIFKPEFYGNREKKIKTAGFLRERTGTRYLKYAKPVEEQFKN
jgi:hypothetical protein